MTEPTVMSMIAEYYRALHSEELCLRLSNVNKDLVDMVIQLCNRHDIPIEGGMRMLMNESDSILKRIEEVSSMKTAEIVEQLLPTTPNRGENQPDSEHYQKSSNNHLFSNLLIRFEGKASHCLLLKQ